MREVLYATGTVESATQQINHGDRLYETPILVYMESGVLAHNLITVLHRHRGLCLCLCCYAMSMQCSPFLCEPFFHYFKNTYTSSVIKSGKNWFVHVR